MCKNKHIKYALSALLLFFLGVKLLVHAFELLICDMGVDLGGGDGGMSKHGLHAADVSSVCQKVSGEAVAQGVRMHIFDDASFGSIKFHNSLD